MQAPCPLMSLKALDAARRVMFRRAGGALIVVSLASVPSIAAAAEGPTASVPHGGQPAVQQATGSAVPHDVPPNVTELSVPAVAYADRAATAATLDDGSTSDAPLVAHLRQPLTHQYSLLGVTWDAGSAAAGTVVTVRTRTAGAWGQWTPLDIDPGEGPALLEEPTTRDGTNPAWVGDSTGVEVAVYSPGGAVPQHLAVDAVDPGTSTYDVTATAPFSTAEAASTQGGPEAGTFPSLPAVITRDEWGVDPSLGDACWDPHYGDTFTMVFVHHTAGSNDYSRAESPAVVRGIYAYHTQARGWCDIGYNFLVDRYGSIYEGRRGGMALPVRGSHAGDYNVDTTGVSLMGNFTSKGAPRSMKHSLVQLIAWRMGTAYHGAYGRPTVNGTRFHRIAGHRDAMSTTCPGDRVYDWLPTLRERVASRLGDYESPIETRWHALGGSRSELGRVHIGDQIENGGHHTAFENGRMYSSAGEVHSLYRGPILHRYLRAGETDGALGYPVSNSRSIVYHTGLSAQFEGGRIFYSGATGSTTLVRSPILKRYLEKGSAAGPLGFPLDRVQATKRGTLARFQHGTISYDAASHKTVVTYG